MEGSDLTPETDRLHVVLSKDYETAALVLCLALGPTTAGPSNISQARTMAWPSTEIDLSRTLLLLKRTLILPPSTFINSLTHYNLQLPQQSLLKRKSHYFTFSNINTF